MTLAAGYALDRFLAEPSAPSGVEWLDEIGHPTSRSIAADVRLHKRTSRGSILTVRLPVEDALARGLIREA